MLNDRQEENPVNSGLSEKKLHINRHKLISNLSKILYLPRL